MNKSYSSTIFACFLGYIVLAIVVNFAPLLFLIFQNSYNVSISQISFLISVNFMIQLAIDFAAAFFIDKLGYRAGAILANAFSAAGLLLLIVLPELFAAPFLGLMIAVCFYAVGGGFLEVLISPIVESCPSDKKEQTMSLLHSFYCWGCVGIISLSTLFLSLFGKDSWKLLCIIWAVLPIIDLVLFIKVPLKPLLPEGEISLGIRKLLKNKVFWLFALIILCSGASEHSIGQWASTFAEMNLGIPKALGDLFGPAIFALAMGVVRLLYFKLGQGAMLEKLLVLSGCLCVVSYLIMVFSPFKALSLLGMALCGLSVSLMWPGTLSLASSTIKNGGNAMFALLALFGDLGGSCGPAVVGLVSGHFSDELRIGILAALLFPLTLCVALLLKQSFTKKQK